MSNSSDLDSPTNAPPSVPLQKTNGTVALIAVVLSVVAMGIALWVLLRPGSGTDAASYGDSQRAEAKSKACLAFATVRTGVSRNTSITVPGGPEDIAGALGVAANARIALFDGGQYLLARLDPATPTELADTVRGFANTLLDIGAAATAGALDGDPEQAARLKSADETNVKIGDLCK